MTMEGFTLRNTETVTTVEYGAGDPTTWTSHLANFSIEPGYLHDMRVPHKGIRFCPYWVEAKWDNGQLCQVYICGPRVLKSGGLSHCDRRHLVWRPVTFPLDYVVATRLIEYGNQLAVHGG